MSSELSEKPHLSPEYYKARKNYNLYAGLLFIWEFIGVDLNTRPWANVNIEFKSPGAAPYVILFILFFYAIRIYIEWQQSDASRRSLRQSKIDYLFSHSIAFFSVLIFFFQLAFKQQLFSFITSELTFFLPLFLVIVALAFFSNVSLSKRIPGLISSININGQLHVINKMRSIIRVFYFGVALVVLILLIVSHNTAYFLLNKENYFVYISRIYYMLRRVDLSEEKIESVFIVLIVFFVLAIFTAMINMLVRITYSNLQKVAKGMENSINNRQAVTTAEESN